MHGSEHRTAGRRRRALGTGMRLIGLIASLFLALGQFGLASAGGWSDRSGGAGPASSGRDGSPAGGGSASSDPIRTSALPTLAKGAGKVTIKWFGQDPDTYDHATGTGGGFG